MQLKHLRNKDINYEVWDDCISKSINSLPYAYSWYLDIVSPGWEAIVSDNYEYVMPLPVKSKYKIPYLVQPVLSQQLGIFSRNEIDERTTNEFIRQIPYYSYELNLNAGNFYPKALIYPNFTLDLNQPYEKITGAYSKNTNRNINKAEKLNLIVKEDISVTTFIEFYYSVEKKFPDIQKNVFTKIIERGIEKKFITLYGVYSEKNTIIAALCILKSNNRIIYLLPVSNSEGKLSSAMFYLINFLIKKEANKDKIFDFEGSAIDGIARFYKGFGAKNQPYYILKRFRPSFLIKNSLIK